MDESMTSNGRSRVAPSRLLYPVPEAREQLGGISHGKFYQLVSAGVVRLTKIGRRSFVSDSALRSAAEWLSQHSHRDAQ